MSGTNKMTQAKTIAADICEQFGEADQFRVALEEHLATWGPHCGAPMFVYVGHLQALLYAAKIAEREACAAIAKAAHSNNDDDPDWSLGYNDAAGEIERKIRARGAK